MSAFAIDSYKFREDWVSRVLAEVGEAIAPKLGRQPTAEDLADVEAIGRRAAHRPNVGSPAFLRTFSVVFRAGLGLRPRFVNVDLVGEIGAEPMRVKGREAELPIVDVVEVAEVIANPIVSPAEEEAIVAVYGVHAPIPSVEEKAIEVKAEPVTLADVAPSVDSVDILPDEDLTWDDQIAAMKQEISGLNLDGLDPVERMEAQQAPILRKSKELTARFNKLKVMPISELFPAATKKKELVDGYKKVKFLDDWMRQIARDEYAELIAFDSRSEAPLFPDMEITEENWQQQSERVWRHFYPKLGDEFVEEKRQAYSRWQFTLEGRWELTWYRYWNGCETKSFLGGESVKPNISTTFDSANPPPIEDLEMPQAYEPLDKDVLEKRQRILRQQAANMKKGFG